MRLVLIALYKYPYLLTYLLTTSDSTETIILILFDTIIKRLDQFWCTCTLWSKITYCYCTLR